MSGQSDAPHRNTGKKKSAGPKIERPDGRVAPFPRARFMEFVGQLKVQSRDYGLVPMELLGSQIYILDEICKGLKEGITTFVILKARQLGASTFFLALDLFWAMEHAGMLGVFSTHEEGAREQFRNQIDVFFQTIPKSYKIAAVTNNRTMLVLQNSSLFRYLIAGTRGTTNKMGRSGGCNFLHSTETAFYGSADDISALNQTLSEIYPHRLYIYESTANGFNHYEEMWETATDSPAQCAIFVGWWRNELYEFGRDHPLFMKYMPHGAKTGLTAHEQKMVTEVREKYGVQLTAGQIAWYRHHLETKCKNDMQQMLQEMPHTPEAAFVSTGSQFFTNEILTSAMRAAKKDTCMPFAFHLTTNAGDTQVKSTTIGNAELKIWEEPVRGARYVIGCDPAYGSNEDSDSSVIWIGRCYADCLVQVAEYATNSVQPYQLAWILAYLSGLYGDVMVILELNGSGHAVLGELTRLRTAMHGVATPQEISLKNCLKYMKEYLYRREDSLGGGLLRQWVTSPNNKVQLMERYKVGFETNRINVKSIIGLEEHRRIVRDEGSIGAGGRYKDDRVIGAALAYYAWDQWVRISMSAQGRTLENEQKIARGGGRDPVGDLMVKFMAARGIKINDEGNDG